MEKLDRVRERISRGLADLRAAEKRKVDASTSLAQAEEGLLDVQEGQKIVQLVAASVQQEIHSRIAGVVSRCLSTVFDEPYEFQVRFDQKRGRTEARLIFLRDGREYEPTEDCGGGVVDVAAFALRVAVLLLQKPPLRRFLVLDEPFRFVSVEYRPRVRALVMELAKELDIQFFLITHDEAFQIGKVIEL